MKKTRQISIPAGNAGESSEASIARRGVLRGIATGALLGMPAMLSAVESGAGRVAPTFLYAGSALGRYGFPAGHPLGVDRRVAFLNQADRQGLLAGASICAARPATSDELGRFHTQRLIDKVRHAERDQIEFPDGGAADGIWRRRVRPRQSRRSLERRIAGNRRGE